MTQSTDNTDNQQKRKAGLFDIRFIIAGLIGVYGVILVLLGLFNASDEELARGDGLNINLWAGLGMIVVSIAFGVWARLRPVEVPVED
jgi:membrane-bound ClpP family serine protease